MTNLYPLKLPEHDEKLSKRLKKTEYAFYPILYAIALDIYKTQKHNKNEIMDVYIDVAKEFCNNLKEFDKTIEKKITLALELKYLKESKK